MTNYLVRLECLTQLGAADDPRAALAADFDAIAEALFDLDDVHDQDLTADLSTGTLTFSIGVDADDESGARDRALGAVRTALHVAGPGTPGWDQHYRMLRQEVGQAPLGAL